MWASIESERHSNNPNSPGSFSLSAQGWTVTGLNAKICVRDLGPGKVQSSSQCRALLNPIGHNPARVDAPITAVANQQ